MNHRKLSSYSSAGIARRCLAPMALVLMVLLGGCGGGGGGGGGGGSSVPADQVAFNAGLDAYTATNYAGAKIAFENSSAKCYFILYYALVLPIAVSM